MATQPDHDPAGNPLPLYKRVALWVLRLLLIPLSAASGAMVYFGLYRSLVTGHLVVTSRGWTSSSRGISFADSPVWFVIFYVLTALMTGMIILVTVGIAWLAFKKIQPPIK